MANRRQRDSIGFGCAISALANDVPNASDEALSERILDTTRKHVERGI
ncbi:MAG: hypothetical protein ACNYPE_14285 [Candidatus Azotimanducaceae bacterium WSBS_2022_MAG_OTU7]